MFGTKDKKETIEEDTSKIKLSSPEFNTGKNVDGLLKKKKKILF
jgi:hypothetical protein